HHSARDAQYVRSVRPRRHDRFLEPRASRAVHVRSLSWRARLRGTGLRAARRARARRARPSRELRLRGGLPRLRRTADPARRAAAGPGPRPRALVPGQARGAPAAPALARRTRMIHGEVLRERLGELARTRRGEPAADRNGAGTVADRVAPNPAPKHGA